MINRSIDVAKDSLSMHTYLKLIQHLQSYIQNMQRKRFRFLLDPTFKLF